MENTTIVTEVTMNRELHYALIELISGIAYRNESDEGNLDSVRKFLLPQAFAKYFASIDYTNSIFKETEFGQYTEMQYNLEALDEFIKKYGEQITEEWNRAEPVSNMPKPNS